MTVRIAALSIYPVKSGRALTLSTATLGLRGFDGDRAWMLVRPDGHVAWRSDTVPADPLELIDTVRGASPLAVSSRAATIYRPGKVAER